MFVKTDNVAIVMVVDATSAALEMLIIDIYRAGIAIANKEI